MAEIDRQISDSRLISENLGHCKCEGGLLLITISDNGAGMSDLQKKKLFHIYSTTKQEGVNTRGIGLGLHICKKIVSELGGDIVCKTTLGQGTKFSFVVRLGQLPSLSLSNIESPSSHIISNPENQRVFARIAFNAELALNRSA